MAMLANKGKKRVFLPERIRTEHYTGPLFGRFFPQSNVFNVFSDEMLETFEDAERIGEIYAAKPDGMEQSAALTGYWDTVEKGVNKGKEVLRFFSGETFYEAEYYNLVQNIFSRNTGILESDIMGNKCAFILGCGSVGSLVALELARSGVGRFVLIDSDIVEYHNLCRHQCSIMDVGNYKVYAVSKRIKEINPSAQVYCYPDIVEQVSREIFDEYCHPGEAILVGCADNRTADVYANSIAVAFGVPFISIGFWERAFAGEIFYWLPKADMPCYRCALGDGGDLSQRQSTNRRIYTTQEDLSKVNFEPGISVDINFVTTIGIKLILDILNIGNQAFTPRLLEHLRQYTLVCNTNNPKIGGDMAEIFSYPLQVTTSLKVNFSGNCPPCQFADKGDST